MKALRLAQSMTLDDLSGRAGVSRAMISRIERGEASPTAQLLSRLCSALGTTLSRFFATSEEAENPLSRRAQQRVWRDPETGYLRRSVSPDNVGSPVDIVEVEFPPGARVVFEQQQFDAGLTQHLWLFAGKLTMTAGEETHVLEAGDCLFMRLAEAHIFHNPHGEPARYAIILNRSKA
ncbi:XRE family transcriptional regulator [Pararhizobium sp. BT-229]|uniref:helix-turn-helix domain-containing protein n=1 Tax=Pararhizobium sp. BT-229 TaxID=2986923 RepID=UPI0021F6A969|nr:XRE family transcriptional regulator [Pararhizobium sp. BT-229]MCV9962145.1 XRE family transcriptional regulator [Pararhizobium sp. BT-229]